MRRPVQRGLGDFATFSDKASGSINSITSTITSLFPKSSGAQTDAGKVATGITQAGKLLEDTGIPGLAQAGQVIEAAGALINAIAGSSKSKELLEKAGQYEQSNALIRIQIDQVANQNRITSSALQNIGMQLKQTGFGQLGSIWEDIFDPGAEGRAQAQLDSASSENELLKKTLTAQVNTLQTYINKFNGLVAAITGHSSTSKIILWSLLAVSVAGIGWAIIASSDGDKKKKKTK